MRSNGIRLSLHWDCNLQFKKKSVANNLVSVPAMHPIQCTLTFPSRGHLSWYSNALGWKWQKVVRDKKFAKIVLIEYAFDFVFSSWNESKMHLPVRSHERASGDGFSVKHLLTYPWEMQTLLFCKMLFTWKVQNAGIYCGCLDKWYMSSSYE